MQDWDIQFLWPENPDSRFVHRMLYALVAEGVRYNVGDYPGRYRIIPINPNKQISQQESANNECTERLADITTMYTDFDPATTELGIDLAYVESTEPIHFGVSIVPTNCSKCRVRFSVVGNEIETKDRFQTFIEVCAGVFERVGFSYGSFRVEHDDWIATSQEEFLQERLRRVTFLSPEIVNEFGRRKLLSAPVEKALELNDGSLVIVITPGVESSGEQLQKVNEYLGLSGL